MYFNFIKFNQLATFVVCYPKVTDIKPEFEDKIKCSCNA